MMKNTIRKYLNGISDGRYGPYGGSYVAETLMPALEELTGAFERCMQDVSFHKEFRQYLEDYIGRPSAMYYAERLTKHCGGAQIWLKREDLNHTGAHKVNNTLGQALLAQRMGKRRLIAETGAGMHGVATATVAALFGMECDVFMGEEDIRRQAPNVARMDMLGARVIPVNSGSATLKDAMNEALRNWVTTVRDTFYVIGTVAGPHPYPLMVKEFQSVIGQEAREQMLKKAGRLPDEVVACVGGGSNALGIFAGFLEDPEVQLVGAEAAGDGIDTPRHAASIKGGSVGVLHGNKTYLLQDDDGQVQLTHSVSAGLDYPGVGPEHAWLHDSGRAEYVTIDDAQAIAAFQALCRYEGIIPALESSHAVAAAMERASTRKADDIILVNLSGRGDKDMQSVQEYLANA
jgi:tryptophan synthase beta chain